MVGAGPGDAGLLTLHGVRALSEATVVLYDDLVGVGVLELVPAKARLVYVGKRAGRSAMPQEEIQQELVRLGLLGERVVRLKGGDPLVFGRGLEELAACQQAGIPVELIPGISSALAAPSYAGIAPTLRGVASSFTVVTGYEGANKPGAGLDWRALAQTPGTLIILMGMGRLRQIVAELQMGGRPAGTPAAVIQWGTCPEQREVLGTLGTLPGLVESAGIGSPAVVVIGEVAGADRIVPWLAKARPLHGMRMVDTRSGRMGTELREMATALGAEVSSVPLIKTVEVVPEALTRELLIGENGDWLVFSSAVAVRLWHGLLRRHRIDGRLLAGRRLAVVGPETARRLEDLAGLTADLIATPARQQGLVAGLTAVHGRGGRAVWFTGDRADRNLETGLGHAGWSVCRVEVYRTEVDRDQATKLAELLAQGQRNTVVFSSGSAVEALEAAWQHIRPTEVPNFRVVTIGPVTSERVRAAGWKVDAEAESPGASGLCAALLRAWSGDHGGN